MRSSKTRFLAFSLLIAAVVPDGHGAIQPFPGTQPGVNIGQALPPAYEPSGAVWHPVQQRLYVVSDDGRLTRIEANGGFPTTWNLGFDLEGVTYADPNSSLLYLGIEHPDAIAEFSLATGTVKRVFDLTPYMVNPANQGLEALTFIPVSGDPEGGVFWAGEQYTGKIYVFSLPILTSATSTAVTHLATLWPVPTRKDMKGLEYDALRGTVFTIWEDANIVGELALDGSVLHEWVLPGAQQEGIAINGCDLYIAEDDTGNVLHFSSFPDTAACRPLTADTTKVSVSGGGVVQFQLHATEGVPAGSLYLIAGSATGTSPGITAGSFHLPLNPDAYFDLTLAFAGVPPFAGTIGTFGGSGPASASLSVPPGLTPALVGLTLHHAFLAADPGSHALLGASNAVVVTFVP